VRELAADPDVILFVDELHNLIGRARPRRGDGAANMLKPALCGGTSG